MSHLIYHHLTDKDKHQICGWKYEGNYRIYNLPPYEKMRRRTLGFMNPRTEKNYYGFYADDLLIGFVNICPKETEVSIGIGLAPAFCGKHYGGPIMETACRLAQKLYPQKTICLEVRTWNKRAIKCYEHIGFQIVGKAYEKPERCGTFYRMIKA